jgi:hypothetical protein
MPDQGPQICSPASCPTALHEDLHGFWQFENNTNDNSGDENHGNTYASPHYVDDYKGKRAAALRFDNASEYVKVDEDVLGDWESMNASMTVTTWVRVHGEGDSSWNRFVDLQNGSNGDAHVLYWDADEHEYGFSTPAGNATVGSDIPQDRWVHLVGVVDNASNEIRFYEDGSLQSTVSATSTWDDLKVSIGDRYDSPGTDWVNATLDQVRVYDRVLNDSEIQSFTNSSCNNQERTIECLNSPELCNTNYTTGTDNFTRYTCNYGRHDNAD